MLEWSNNEGEMIEMTFYRSSSNTVIEVDQGLMQACLLKNLLIASPSFSNQINLFYAFHPQWRSFISSFALIPFSKYGKYRHPSRRQLAHRFSIDNPCDWLATFIPIRWTLQKLAGLSKESWNDIRSASPRDFSRHLSMSVPAPLVRNRWIEV